MKLIHATQYNPHTGAHHLPQRDNHLTHKSDHDIHLNIDILHQYLPFASEPHSMSTTDLGLSAARELFKNTGISAHTLDSIVVATSTAERGFPSDACLIQLGLDARNVNYAIDVNAYPDNPYVGIYTALSSPSYSNKGHKLVIITDNHHKWEKLGQGNEPPKYLGSAIALLFLNTTECRYPAEIRHLPYLATGHYLPGAAITNEDIVRMVPELNQYDQDEQRVKTFPSSIPWIESMVGTKVRHTSKPDEDCVDLTEQALSKIQKRHPFPIDQLNTIIVSTISASQDLYNPACNNAGNPKHSVVPVARRLAERIGANPDYTVDVGAACAGFAIANYLANTAPRPIRLLRYGYSLLFGVEQLSRMIDFNDDRDSNLVLFGDGCGGILQGPPSFYQPHVGLHSISTTSFPFDGRAMDIFRNERGLIRMPNGSRVLKDATRSMIENAHAAMEYAGWTKDMIDLMAPHQANQRIIDAVIRKDGLDPAIVLQTIDRTANISNATIPVGLSLLEEEGKIQYLSREEKGMKIVMTQFGSGEVGSAIAAQF
ncbi:MAG: 3-oxoacyl-[acyl-carrier-protein] synthase III C-terminal domain-containing protein [Nanoarchaeota archaeon]